MKIALVTDTHFGARSDSTPFDNFFNKFYTEVFFPYIDEHKISTVIHLGDVFDRRKYINYNTLKSCREYFFNKLKSRNIDTHLIVGNHDTYFKNTNDVNSLHLLLSEYPNIKAYSDPHEIKFEDCNILLMPWICSDNYSICMNSLTDSKAKIVFGHFEIAGFQMYKGQVNEHGLGKDVFKKFDKVYSGHFHTKSTDDNITYLGTPYEITWADYNDPRGFHIFDTDTGDIEFIENPNIIFTKYYYDEDKEDPNLVDTSTFENKHIKLIVVNKKDFVKFDQFVEKLYSKNPLELKIIEDMSEFETEATEDVNLEDTMTLLSSYVDNLETDADKNRLKILLKSLYVEAQEYEDV